MLLVYFISSHTHYSTTTNFESDHMKFQLTTVFLTLILCWHTPVSQAQAVYTQGPCAGLTTLACAQRDIDRIARETERRAREARAANDQFIRQQQENWDQMQRDIAQAAAEQAEEQAEKKRQRYEAMRQYEEEQRRKMEQACRQKGFMEQYYQECILDSMPGAKNLVAVRETIDYCASKAPCNIVKAKRSGLFGVTTANGCFKKYGKRQSLAIAAHQIQSACYDLYEDK